MRKDDEKLTSINTSESSSQKLRKRMERFVGKVIIDGLVEIDDGPYLDEIQRQIKAGNPQDDTTKYSLLHTIPMNLLEDALTASQKTGHTAEVKTAIEKALEVKQTRMSEIIQGGYGLCRHFITISLLSAEAMEVPFALQGNAQYRHTFGKAKLFGTWMKVDPFAVEYFHNQGEDKLFFPDFCYRSFQVQTFAITSQTSEREIREAKLPL